MLKETSSHLRGDFVRKIKMWIATKNYDLIRGG